MSELLARYGLWLLFAVVLAEQLGVPIPAMPLVMLAGARVADDPIYGVIALLVAVLASTLIVRRSRLPVPASRRT